VTYQGFAAAWPSMTDEQGFADRMNSLPKFVSTTLTQVEWSNSSLIKGNIAAEVRQLKQEPGRDILVAGCGALVRTQMQHDLVHEFRLMIHPVVLGSGKRLFEDGTDRKVIRLTDARTFSSGVVVLSNGRGETGVG
jgi:dihydrofolate reductase